MGKVLNIYKVSSIVTFTSHVNIEEMVISHINQVLDIMPKGTKHLSTEQMLIYDLSISFLITFDHPLFEDNTVLDLQYRRAAYVDESRPEKDKIVQLTLFTGVTYKSADGKLLYGVEEP